MGLGLRLALLVVLALLPARLLALYEAAEERQIETGRAQAEALRLTRVVSETQEQLIDGTRQLLQTLAQVPAVRGRDAAACTQLAADLLRGNPLYLNIIATDPAGAAFCNGLRQPGALNYADRPYFQRLLQSRQLEISEFQLSRSTGKASVAMAYPALDGGGQVQAVVIAALDLGWLNELAAQAQLPPGTTLTLFDRNGTVLVRHPDAATWVGQSVPDAEIVRMYRGSTSEGTAEATGLDGVPRLYAFAPMRGTAQAIDGYVTVGVPRDVAFAAVDAALRRNTIGLVATGLLAALVAWLAGRAMVVRPVKALVRTARRIGQGDLTARTGLRHDGTEIGALAAAVDDMARSLAELEDERRENARLEAERERLAELDRLKTEFVNLVSHELRTPLTSIRGYVLLLRERAGLLGEEERGYLERVRANADRLLAMVNDLLDVSRIEAGKLELRIEPLDLATVVWDVAQLLQPQLEEKEQMLDLELADELPTVVADGDRLRQVLTNLLSNAHKYTPAGGRIVIRTRVGDGRVRLEVADSGVGMTVEEQRQLFSKFFRSRGQAARQAGGTGLGLVIAKSIVELHGGRMTVESSPGEGSTFGFELPYAAAPAKVSA